MRTPRKKPWKLGRKDFNRQGRHTRATHGFYLWFYFLRLSPTYFWAHKERHGKLTEAERARLPADFDHVLATYDQFGDVWHTLFETWWRKNGLRLFGVEGDKPEVAKLMRFPGQTEVMSEECLAALDDYLLEQRRAERWPEALLVSIPLTGKKTEILKAIGQLIDEAGMAPVSAMPQPLYKMTCQRLHVDPLIRGIQLLVNKAVDPKLALWRLGARVKLSKTYSQLDPTATKLTKDTEELRSNLTMLASRALRHAQLVMENAARGQFPSHAEVDLTHIAWRDISVRIRAFRKWEKTEEERLRAWYEKRQAERAAQVQARVEDQLFDIE